MTPLTPLGVPAQGASPFAAAGDAVQTPALTSAQQGAFAREFSRAKSLACQEAPTASAIGEAAATDESGDAASDLVEHADAGPEHGPIQALRELLQRVADDSGRVQAGVEADPAAGADAATNATGETADAEDTPVDRASMDGALRASDRREATPPAHEAEPATPPTDPSFVVRDLGALQPEFREKVERVMARMKEEHGLDVSVAETWRGQPRQEHLYEQGRSRAGAVVTWTRRSRHTEGRAADLVVNGPVSADGYRLLGLVARQEGLQTLGIRDPGHVELAAVSRDGPSVLPGAPRVMEMGIAGAATLADAAVVAPVASVASVAAVAPVASVATVAPVIPPPPGIRSAVGGRDGDARLASRIRRPSDKPSVPQEGRLAVAADTLPTAQHRVESPRSAGTPETSARAERWSRGDRRSTALTREAAEIASGGSPFSARAAAYAAATPTPWPAASASAAGGSPGVDTTARIAQVTGLQDARSALPISHMILHLDTPDGSVDRVRVALQGARVGATIELHDGASAAGLSRRLPELVAALEARGLESGHLRVQPTTGHDGTTLADLVRATVGDASAARGTLFASSEGQFSRSRDNEPGGHTQQESPRHRSRREQKDSTR